MTSEATAETIAKSINELAADIPMMFCAADVEEGQKRVSEARSAISLVQKAIDLGELQIMMVRVCDLVDGAVGLETLWIDVEMESDDEGGVEPRMNISCQYTELGEGAEENGENIEDSLHGWLSVMSSELCDEDITGKVLAPNDFIKELAKEIMGLEAGPAWLAAREAAAIDAVVSKAAKRSGTVSL